MANDTNFTVPTLAELVDGAESEINSRITGADAKLRRSTLHVLARVMSGMGHGLFGHQKYISRQIHYTNAEAEELEKHGDDWGVQRLGAAKATGTISFSGTNGTIVPGGTQIKLSNNETFTTTAAGTVAAGTVSLAVEADNAGAAGNTNGGVSASLVTTIAGITTGSGAVDAAGLSGGAAVESDAAYRVRIGERVKASPHGGTESDYSMWAKEASANVTRVWATPLGYGPGTVVVRFVTDDSTTVDGPENLLKQSEVFTDSYWAKGNVTVTLVADPQRPAGYGSAFYMHAGAVNAEHKIAADSFDFVLEDDTAHKLSIVARAADQNFLWVRTTAKDGSQATTWFDLGAGAVGTTGAAHTATLANLTAGWHLTTVELDILNGATTPNFEFGVSDVDGSTTFLGAGVPDGIYIMGAHLRRSSVTDDYVETVDFEIVADKIIPSDAEVATVLAYLTDAVRKPVGAEVFVVAPLARPVQISISNLSPDTTTVRAAIESELADMFLREAEVGGTLPVSKIWESISIATGEVSHTVTLPSADINLQSFQIPVLGTVSYV